MTASIEVHLMNTMRKRLSNLGPRLNAAVDWFIPAQLMQSKKDTLQAVRMFLFSHLFGPLLGHTISLSMLFIGGEADASWWIFFLAVTAFWPMAFLLRLTGWYVPLALISIENLMFCIFWGCYQYGGISSPIMPWLVTVPLLAFFYLPERSTRIAVAILIAANLALFYGVYSTTGFHDSVAQGGLVLLGLISTLCASVYVSMMALYHASIVSSQGELEQEVLRHQATEKQLRDATGQAQRALLAKSEFLAKMSHELKNPLNAIIGYSEILIEDVRDEQVQKRKDLTSIRGAGYRLLALIDSLLELSRLEAGRVQLRCDEFEFAELFNSLVARMQPDIAAGGNQLTVQHPPGGRIVCDMQKLQRVLEGLLNNAAKFTRNGQVTLTAALRGDTCVLSVKDTGIGIAAERMASLFETFGLSGDETASRYGDEVRLGLPLAYRYCRLMGGELAVDSAPGRGCTVTVTLPRRLPVEEQRPDARAALHLRAA
ncbi:MAG: HAMP domain-containing histidine kinase [Rubrivivax sp.]|nr:HAMP domain-containing histidine kinase [Rubrivivax sp.]